MSLHDEIKEQQKKLKGQGFKAHWEYFWEYYKIHTFVAIAAIILLTVLIKDISNNKPYALYAVLLNSNVPDTQQTFESDFTEYAQIDTNSYTCFVDTSSSYRTDAINEMTIATSEKIMANISAKELDVMAADTDMFRYYAYQDVYMDLRDAFDQAFLDKYSDKICYVDRKLIDYISSEEYQDFILNGKYDKSNKYAVMAAEIYNTGLYPDTPVSEMEDPIPVGFYIEDSNAIKENNAYYGQKCIVGVIINTGRLDTAKQFVEFLLQ
ncbi:MAG: hypothetical protein E7304_09945 [Butyrivibrio sp.]|uniref:hypothetical protein n=1 Tax=Butyrivibrio sp. TaxID=28121 RepID=UPI001ED07A38|nr:hypothetical protein [Butyrivibrio sp.]MBE5841710.1 hypothetical protein [Butyrivibrio sp.]